MSDEFEKLPAAKVNYEIDWTQWLQSDTIGSSTWTVPAGITRVDDTNTTKAAQIIVEGGTAGESYDLVNHIVTAGGLEDERTITIHVVAELTPCPSDVPLTDAELVAAIDAEIAANPGGITSYELADGRKTTRMSLVELLRARGIIEVRNQRNEQGMFSGARLRRPGC